METRDTKWHWAIALGCVVWMTAASAWACSLAAPPRVDSGILGTSFSRFETEEILLPQNFGVVSESTRPMLDDGTPLGFAPSSELSGLSHVVSMPAVGSTIQTGTGATARIDDFVDDTPPGMAAVTGGQLQVSQGSDDGGCTGGGFSSCGDITTLRVDIEVTTDDHTPQDRLTYALFTGETEERVLSSIDPDGFFLDDGSTVWRFGDASERHADIWVTVAAIDFAGNIGPRATPMQIHMATASDDGCEVAPGARPWSSPLPYAFVLGAVVIWRARRRTTNR